MVSTLVSRWLVFLTCFTNRIMKIYLPNYLPFKMSEHSLIGNLWSFKKHFMHKFSTILNETQEHLLVKEWTSVFQKSPACTMGVTNEGEKL
jgi:hypothetical protein